MVLLVTPQEAHQTIMTSEKYGGSDHDGLPTTIFLKKTFHLILPYILLLFNNFLQASYLSMTWPSSTFIPILKSSHNSPWLKYIRPILHICCLSKVSKSKVNRRLQYQTHIVSPLHATQHNFSIGNKQKVLSFPQYVN